MSCSTINYYGQLSSGQLQQLNARQSVDELIANQTTDTELRRKLLLVETLLEFAKTHYELDAGDSYQYYIDVGSQPPQWLVSAAPEFSLTPKQWCYPIAGCMNYRNFWQKEDALKFASRLFETGYDTAINGAGAWSTLGWLSDPIMSNWLLRTDQSAARTLFHELVHRRFYFPNEPKFNEGLASALAEIMLYQWLFQTGKTPSPLIPISTNEAISSKPFDVDQLKSELNTLFRSPLEESEKRVKKEEIYTAFANRFPEHFVPINNAELALYRTYHDYSDELITLYYKCKDNHQFYQWVDYVGLLDSEAIKQALESPNCLINKG